MIKIKKNRRCLHIEISAPQWKNLPGLRRKLETATEAVLIALPPELKKAAEKSEFTVLLTSGREIKRLNSVFRGLDKPTNVLSFPYFSRSQLKAAVKERKGSCTVYAGDIAIAFECAFEESRQENKKLVDHVVHLLIHGILHLFGYDHNGCSSALVMERLERKIMSRLGLPDPYAPLVSPGNMIANKKRKKA